MPKAGCPRPSPCNRPHASIDRCQPPSQRRAEVAGSVRLLRPAGAGRKRSDLDRFYRLVDSSAVALRRVVLGEGSGVSVVRKPAAEDAHR